MTEAQMAEKVIAWLQADGYDIYQEVSCYDGSRRADIVGVKGARLVVVECKLALSFELLAQGCHWKPYATSVYLAVAAPRRDPDRKSNRWKGERSDGRGMALRVVRMLGLGCLEVKSLWPLEEQHGIGPITVSVAPEVVDGYLPRLRDSLQEGHKDHAKAGTNRGGQFTRFRATCEALGRYAHENPGAKLREALKVVPHHYSSINSAVASLGKWAAKDAVRGVRIENDGINPPRIYPMETG